MPSPIPGRRRVMPLSAYIFIESTPGKVSQVVEAVAKLPGVKMAHAVTGSSDVIAFVEARAANES
jgi:DNA-binding Lrp family transcriptional regulator